MCAKASTAFQLLHTSRRSEYETGRCSNFAHTVAWARNVARFPGLDRYGGYNGGGAE